MVEAGALRLLTSLIGAAQTAQQIGLQQCEAQASAGAEVRSTVAELCSPQLAPGEHAESAPSASLTQAARWPGTFADLERTLIACNQLTLDAALRFLLGLLCHTSSREQLTADDFSKLAQCLGRQFAVGNATKDAPTLDSAVGIFAQLAQHPQHAACLWRSDAPAALLVAMRGADAEAARPWQHGGADALVVLEASLLTGMLAEAADADEVCNSTARTPARS